MIAVKIRLQDTKNGPARRPPKTRQNRAAEKTFFKTCQKPSKFVKNDLRSMLLVGRHQKPDFHVRRIPRSKTIDAQNSRHSLLSSFK